MEKMGERRQRKGTRFKSTIKEKEKTSWKSSQKKEISEPDAIINNQPSKHQSNIKQTKKKEFKR
jgi:hypothetical protein